MIRPSELLRVIVDTTVQPKNVTFPTDAKLLNRAREKLVQLAQRHGVDDRSWREADIRRSGEVRKAPKNEPASAGGAGGAVGRLRLPQ